VTQKINVNNIRIYAFHGCLPEEALIGSNYRVDITVTADLRKSAKSDALKDTVDYVSLTTIVREEMTKRSELLEAVAQRITERVFSEHPLVEHCLLRVAKICPPIEADLEDVAVIWEMKRE
jgi:7,8-dihydroneopterin aldolase/epimerase/oxygenase